MRKAKSIPNHATSITDADFDVTLSNIIENLLNKLNFDIFLRKNAKMDFQRNGLCTITFAGGVRMNKDDQDKIINICSKNDISMIGLFGSTVRGDATESSDIDLIVKLSKPKSLLSLVKLERNLSEAIGKKVDLLTEGAISPYLKERIFKELTVIYGTR